VVPPQFVRVTSLGLAVWPRKEVKVRDVEELLIQSGVGVGVAVGVVVGLLLTLLDVGVGIVGMAVGVLALVVAAIATAEAVGTRWLVEGPGVAVVAIDEIGMWLEVF